MQLISLRTAEIQRRVVEDFNSWLARELSEPARRSLCSFAMVYCILLRAYGDWLFQMGEPLYKFRHLMAYLQKSRLDLRPFLGMGWDLKGPLLHIEYLALKQLPERS